MLFPLQPWHPFSSGPQWGTEPMPPRPFLSDSWASAEDQPRPPSEDLTWFPPVPPGVRDAGPVTSSFLPSRMLSPVVPCPNGPSGTRALSATPPGTVAAGLPQPLEGCWGLLLGPPDHYPAAAVASAPAS